jgi:histidyl-tRNA synthetase
VVVGPDDRARGEVQLKDLADQTQDAVPLDRVVERCRTLLTRTG